MVNEATLIGRLTHDPETFDTKNGSGCHFNIAVNEGKNKSGEEVVSFLRCTAWGKDAENIAQYFSKGKPIYVKCRLRNDKWEDKDGNTRSNLSLHVFKWSFLPSDNTKNTQDTQDTENEPKPRNQRNTRKSQEEKKDDDDIPF